MAHRILVVGAGAVGGYFGAKLAAAGRDVTFLVRSRRAEQLRRDGLRIVSPHHGDLTIAPKLVTADTLAAPYDVVFVSVKAFALDDAMRDFAPAVGPDSVILPVLNGMQHMAALTQHFGPRPVIGGVCLVATELDPDGRIVQLAPAQQLTYGELDGAVSPRIQAVDAAMQNAGFAAELSREIGQRLWEKWVMLAGVGATTCLLRGNVGQIVAAPGGAEVATAIVDECAAVAAACGHPTPPSLLERLYAAITAAGSDLTSSMYRDLRKGAPVEADAIVGDLIQRGREAGVTAPLLQAAFVNLRVYAGGLAA